ncbi:MAG: alpha/beta hydrolase [Oscillospiraceae bacterium]|nr:alpha/beta hydrolase [Oscillospiraceae bacterium]
MHITKKRPRWKTILKWFGVSLLALIIFAVLFVCATRVITRFSNRINTENGIDEGIYVSLGGQEQYLLIRGEDVNNPVMLWLHGGPASPDTPLNYTFQKHLVGEYTVVNWDQRGCGRTYYRNMDTDPNNETASFEQAQTDLDELVDYLVDRFDTEKVIIVGHSYGTMLGSKYVLEHPEKVAAYIGVGQVVSFESEFYSYEDALAAAKSRGDDTTDLEAAHGKCIKDMTLVNFMHLRGLVSKYHPAEKSAHTLWLGIASPHIGIDDLRWFSRQIGGLEEHIKLNQQLFDSVMTVDIREYGLEYHVPVGFISGADDWITPVKYSEDYYNSISAPSKDFALIADCGHSPNHDAPTAFCDALEKMLSEIMAYQ